MSERNRTVMMHRLVRRGLGFREYADAGAYHSVVGDTMYRRSAAGKDRQSLRLAVVVALHYAALNRKYGFKDTAKQWIDKARGFRKLM